MEKGKWYNEKTYRFTMIGLFCLMTFFTLGTWYIDGEVKELGAVYLFGGGMVVTTLFSLFLRNNS